ncbi:MAG: c-type cytochrome, partial [Planctomycetaceae bacterium]
NPYGLTFDPLGNLYSADCHSLPLTLLLRGAYYSSFGKPHDGLGFGPNMIDHSHGSTGICGPAYYAATQFPEDYRDNLYLCNPVTGRVHRDKLMDHGSTRLVDTQPDFITCDDGWFRPVDLQVGPDGCLYVADFYNAIIGHYEVELKHPRRDRHHGRVWRVVYRGEDGSIQPPPMPDLTVLSLDELVAKLGDPNLAVRTLATNELIDRFGESAAPAVARVLDGESSPEQRVHAMWVLERLGRLSTEQIVGLSQVGRTPLNNRLVRTHVARLIAERPDWASNEQLTATLRLLTLDGDGFVRRAAVDALGRQPHQTNIRLLLSILEYTPPEDTHLRHTIRIALRNHLRNDAIARSGLAEGTDNAGLRELMSVSLAVQTEAVAGFLAMSLNRCDEPPSRLLEYAQHIARFGTADHLEQSLSVWESRFPGDLARQHEILLVLRDGLERRGNTPSEFLEQRAAVLAQKLMESGDERAMEWRTLTVSGAAAVDQVWTTQSRACQDGAAAEFFSTLPRGEQVTGIHRSSPFVLPERLSCYIAGHSGRLRQENNGLNRVRLVDAQTGLTLAEAGAPRNDVAQEVVWDLGKHAGRSAYVELTDGDAGTAYAWLAVGRFSIDALNPSRFTPADAAVELIARYRLDALRPQLRKLLNDHTTTLVRRTAAARALVSLDPNARLQALLPFASDPRISDTAHDEILGCVEAPEAERIDSTLAAIMQSLPAAQQEGFALSLAADRDGGEALLKLVESGKASRRLLLNGALAGQLAAARVRDVERRLAELTRGLPSGDEQIAERIARHRESFDVNTASTQQGREVFEKVCAACHRIGEKGTVIGPQLDGVGIRGVDRLLEDLLDPNRNVDGAFRITTILQDDGKVLTGLFRRQEGETLVFADQKGKEFTVQAADIEEQSLSSVSLMPTNLYETVQPDLVDDLLAYLLAQRTTPAKPSE